VAPKPSAAIIATLTSPWVGQVLEPLKSAVPDLARAELTIVSVLDTYALLGAAVDGGHFYIGRRALLHMA
jgi:hypothetical protein